MLNESEESVWTYTPTKSERAYLTESLGEFFEDELLVDILYKVRAGKEATCYCCRAHEQVGGGLLAAKVYRPREFRTMRNDWYYRIGRTMSTGGRGVSYRGRVQRALKKHSRFGKQVETNLESVRKTLPADLVLARTSDQPLQVHDSIELFSHSLIEALVLVVKCWWNWPSHGGNTTPCDQSTRVKSAPSLSQRSE